MYLFSLITNLPLFFVSTSSAGDKVSLLFICLLIIVLLDSSDQIGADFNAHACFSFRRNQLESSCDIL